MNTRINPLDEIFGSNQDQATDTSADGALGGVMTGSDFSTGDGVSSAELSKLLDEIEASDALGDDGGPDDTSEDAVGEDELLDA